MTDSDPSPRFWIDYHGHRFVRTADGSTLSHHRLVAYAHDMIDSLDDPREVDHTTGIPWLDYEAGLQTLSKRDHGRVTRAREQRRNRRERTLAAFTDGGENGDGQA
jgi:hypothetical protein